MPQHRNWQRSEQMLALELYFTTPFGKIHSKNPEIIRLSQIIGRTPGAVALKMANFAALDPTINRKGMGNYSRADGELWEEFFADPIHFLSRIQDVKHPDQVYSEGISAPNVPDEVREGTDVSITSTSRRNQDFFRDTLMASYNGKCAVTRISQPQLLSASHIIPWSKNKSTRLNPQNGILLNVLHDRAFDRGLITFDDDYTMIVSKHLKLNSMAKKFFEVSALLPPEKFAPDPIFLKYHREHEFEKFL